MAERPTFSPFWHRVRAMRPKLRPHVQVTRQRYRGRRWHVVHDPTSNQFYRLNPIAFDFVSMLDGNRTVEEAWKVSLSKFGDSAPTQNEVIQLMSQLYSSNLLSVDTTPETEQLLNRGRERLKKKMMAQAVGIMYFKIKLFNPDRLLTALEPIFRPLINRWGLLLWFVVVGAALYAITDAQKWDEFFGKIQGYFDPGNWGLILVAFVVTKLWHELGHGIICKRFGGQVPEFGAMLLVLIPSPYVDASACWAFPSKYKRMAVGAGGMLFEWVLASAATFVWLFADEGTVTQLAYNIMFTSSVSTVLFNANPLMRFDGYYMLADLLEVPNLAQRSNKMLLYYIQKYIYRIKNVTPPTTLPSERVILIVYGILAGIYRVFLFFSITLYVLGKAFAIGLLLAMWTAAAWFLIPLGKFVHWLASSSALNDKRGRAIMTSLALIALGFVLIGWIPMPDHRRGIGVVESGTKTGVFFKTDGFVLTVHKKIGDAVEAGEALVTLENPELLAQKASLVAQLEEARVQERAGLAESEPGAAEISRDRIRVTQEQLEKIDERIANLVVRSPHAGVVVTRDPEVIHGGFVRRGEGLCEIVDVEDVRIAAVLDQRQAGWLADVPADDLTIQVRPVSDVDTVMKAGNLRTPGAGTALLPSAALSFAGGGKYQTEERDESGRISKRPVFTVHVDPEDTEKLLTDAGALPGTRVHVRFRLENRPWLQQWWERLERELQGRVKL